MTTECTYHALLIGIDQYPARYNADLHGCLNDINAIERLLLDGGDLGLAPERVRVTRMATPVVTPTSTTRFAGATCAPTKANLIEALQALAGPQVAPADRVLIYYSGHGIQQRWTGSDVWHEALVPHDGQDLQPLFDVEINALLRAIAQRTGDLTVVFDCCHSAGAARELVAPEPEARARVLTGAPIEVEAPDLSAVDLGSAVATSRSVGMQLLQDVEASYLVAVACQSNEKAGEGAYPHGEASHGVFTHSLLSVLASRDPARRAELRWADIWPALLATASERNSQLRQRTQHPWIIGRGERRVFGGPWEPGDVGYTVMEMDSGYRVGAGILMGITLGAEIAVYGREPRYFPPLGSPEDRPSGRLQVIEVGLSSASATPIGAAFPLPEGARGRLVKPGESARLRVSLEPEDPAVADELSASPHLEIVPASDPGAEVEVVARAGHWVVGNDTEPQLAVVPEGATEALVAGLEHYARYNTVLRMAQNCAALELAGKLSVQLLDCSDQAALDAMSPQELADPKLQELPRDTDLIYHVEPDHPFCVRVANSSRHDLNVTVLNCSAGGLVEYLSDAVLRAGAAQVMWYDGQLGVALGATLDPLPDGEYGVWRPDYTTERLIAIATTRLDVPLDHLKVEQHVQQVVNELLQRKAALTGEKAVSARRRSAAPAEMWTATVTPLRITRE